MEGLRKSAFKLKNNFLPNKGEMFQILVAEAMKKENKTTSLSEKQLLHLHKIFGHIQAERLNRHIQELGYSDNGEAKRILEKIQDKCIGCCLGQKRKPKAKFSLPKVDSRNQIVTLDLKECNKRTQCTQQDEHSSHVRTRRS